MDDLRRWVRHLDRGQAPPSVAEARELDEILAQLTRFVAPTPKREEAATLALLELVRVGEEVARTTGFGPRAEEGTPFLRGQVALRARLLGPSGEACLGVLQELLQGNQRGSSVYRQSVARILGQVRPQGSLGSLLAVSQDPDAFVAQEAQRALVGWDDPRVHLLFLDLVDRRQAVRLAVQHLEATEEDLGPVLLDRLRGIVGRLILSEDWRDAARALDLVGVLDTERAVPLLIEALTAWGRRAEAGTGSRRIIEEIVIELRRLSGRNLGREPERWHRWWSDVLRGAVLLPEAAQARGEPMTQATFFGLRLASDRVLFLVDRSGSMEETFGTGGETRYEEAIDQLFVFLKSAGPSTRFGLALFHDKGALWRSGRLVEATPPARKQARRWLSTQSPGGGTELRRGLLKALGCDRDGRINPERLEADTLVVLCDGATAQGPGWVTDWIGRTGEDLQLVIHGVQIGAFGDGTLEALAHGTGGQFVRIQR